jgi:hypothetical protein
MGVERENFVSAVLYLVPQASAICPFSSLLQVIHVKVF